MNLKAVLTVSAFYQAIIGIGMILVPRRFGIGAVPADASPALKGIAVLNWMARNEGGLDGATRDRPRQSRGVWPRRPRGRAGRVHRWRALDRETYQVGFLSLGSPPTRHGMWRNLLDLRTAQTLGLTIPPALLLRVDQVIE